MFSRLSRSLEFVAPLISSFNLIARDTRCMILWFLPLNEVMLARRTCKESMKLPLALCYRPPRLSCVPINALIGLIAWGHLNAVVKGDPYQKAYRYLQLPIAYLNQLSQGIWDTRDVIYEDLPEQADIRFKGIKEIILKSDGFNKYPRDRQLPMMQEGPTICKYICTG